MKNTPIRTIVALLVALSIGAWTAARPATSAMDDLCCDSVDCAGGPYRCATVAPAPVPGGMMTCYKGAPLECDE